MKTKTRKALNMTAEQAVHALHVLVADGKLMAKDVTNALKRREQMIRDLRSKLASLEFGAVAKDGPFPMVAEAARKARGRAKRKMSAARRAALRLQGKYIGTVRTLSKDAKAKVKAVREKSGVRAAIAAAKKLAK